MIRRTRLAVLSTACALALFSMAPASAFVMAAGPGSTAAGYATPVAFAPQGETVTFANGDIDGHDIRSELSRPSDSAPWCILFQGACPLFYAEQIGFGQTTEVIGSSTLPPGEYGFYCAPHPWMQGILVIR